jgi:O-6-methylguanine DNA methyltransferase
LQNVKEKKGQQASKEGTFAQRVLSIVRRIPVGRVATYGDVARLAGKPRAARAVGNIMRSSTRRDVPYHRVIAAGGRLGGYGGNELLKRSLLVAEGVTVSGSRVRPFERFRWVPPGRQTFV